MRSRLVTLRRRVLGQPPGRRCVWVQTGLVYPNERGSNKEHLEGFFSGEGKGEGEGREHLLEAVIVTFATAAGRAGLG